MMRQLIAVALGAWIGLSSTALQADEIELKDPRGDDDGPGSYTYPTDAVYKRGSFDLTEVSLKEDGDDIKVTVSFAARIEDPWRSSEWGGNGFSLQMVFLFFDTDHVAGSGHKDGLSGLNVRFREESRWEKVLIISPQGTEKLRLEVRSKARRVRSDVILPSRVRVRGRSIVATFPKSALGTALRPGLGLQALVQSNEGYPKGAELLTRPVNEYRGAHRFGGGSDYDCDPHVIEMLAGEAQGEASEAAAQHEALGAFQCTDDPDEGSRVELPMVYPGN